MVTLGGEMGLSQGQTGPWWKGGSWCVSEAWPGSEASLALALAWVGTSCFASLHSVIILAVDGLIHSLLDHSFIPLLSIH
jgi:hypothetical protein